MGALKFVWDAKEASTRAKMKLCEAMPMNSLLWGSENWSRNKADTAMAEAFHHKSIRRMLGISMMQVKEQEIKNEEVRRRFGNIECMTGTWRRRQLLFIGRIVRLGHKKTSINSININSRWQKRKRKAILND